MDCLWCGKNVDGVDSRLCSSCKEDQLRRGGHTQPRNGWIKMGDEDPFMGVEVEIDSSEPARGITKKLLQEVSDIVGALVIPTFDCTLHQKTGIEFCTLPCSMSFHEDEFPWMAFSDLLWEHNYKNIRNAGLHIHMSADHLSTIDQIKLGIFWYSHQHLMNKLSRRCPGSFRRGFGSVKDFLDTRKDGGSYSARGGGRMLVSYSAKSKGIEFRQFNGAWRYHTIMSSLRIVHTLQHFVQRRGVPYLTSSRAGQRFMEEIKKFDYVRKYLKGV